MRALLKFSNTLSTIPVPICCTLEYKVATTTEELCLAIIVLHIVLKAKA